MFYNDYSNITLILSMRNILERYLKRTQDMTLSQLFQHSILCVPKLLVFAMFCISPFLHCAYSASPCVSTTAFDKSWRRRDS